MKIFSFIGSRRHDSNTVKMARMIIEGIRERSKEEVEYEIFTPEDLKLEACRGCNNCFKRGFCTLDSRDNFSEIKQKLLAADIIIIGSPVYAAAVSGDTKVFIDRLSYWLHLLPLAGKIGVSVITASNNSAMETNSYLKRMMESWGLHMACSVVCTVDAPNMIDNLMFKTQTVPRYIEMVTEYFQGNKEIIPSDYQERYFLHLRETYNVARETTDAEFKFWRSRGYLKHNSFKELVDNLKANSINSAELQSLLRAQ